MSDGIPETRKEEARNFQSYGDKEPKSFGSFFPLKMSPARIGFELIYHLIEVCDLTNRSSDLACCYRDLFLPNHFFHAAPKILPGLTEYPLENSAVVIRLFPSNWT
jgi:hypothetical protein